MTPDLATEFIDTIQQGFLQGDESAANKPLEAHNVRLVQEQYRAIARGDFAAFAATLDEKVELEIVGPASIPFVGSHRGRQQVAEAVRNNFGLLAEQQPEIRAVVAQGDTVVVHGHERGRFRSTGRAYEIHWVQFFTFRGDKVIRLREVFDSAPMLEAVRA